MCPDQIFKGAGHSQIRNRRLSHQTKPTRAAIAWSLYDWANSAFPTVITTFIFAAYFTQSIAIDPISGTHQWANATALAGLIIAILGPILGATADYLGRRKPWIAFFTALSVISAALLWFAKPSPSYIPWALTWVVIGTIGFEISTVFYNAMMRALVPESYLGRISGWSWGVGYLGGLSCLCLALFLINTPVPWLNSNPTILEHIRIAGPLTAVWFALFSLPFFFFTPDHKRTGIPLRLATQKGIMDLIQIFRKARAHRQILKYLFAHMIYIDGLNTLFAFGGIYAAGTFGLSPDQIILLGILMNITAGLGAISFAWIDDYLGSKHTILIGLCGLALTGSGLLIVHVMPAFWTLALLLGLFVGPVQSASRSLMTHLSPPRQLTELFGLYAFSGKITAFIGPWVLGFTTAHFASQRAGMATIILFLIVGSLILLSVQRKDNSIEKHT